MKHGETRPRRLGAWPGPGLAIAGQLRDVQPQCRELAAIVVAVSPRGGCLIEVNGAPVPCRDLHSLVTEAGEPRPRLATVQYGSSSRRNCTRNTAGPLMRRTRLLLTRALSHAARLQYSGAIFCHREIRHQHFGHYHVLDCQRHHFRPVDYGRDVERRRVATPWHSPEGAEQISHPGQRRGWHQQRRGWHRQRRAWHRQRRAWHRQRRAWSGQRRGISPEGAEQIKPRATPWVVRATPWD